MASQEALINQRAVNFSNDLLNDSTQEKIKLAEIRNLMGFHDLPKVTYKKCIPVNIDSYSALCFIKVPDEEKALRIHQSKKSYLYK